jgi:(2R)-3-sulfolactate dehydrogenase (NADP+)
LVQVSVKDIEDATQSALLLHGAGSFAAAEVARAVARAEATGNAEGGLLLLETHCRQLLAGLVKGEVVPVVETLRSACIVVDAGGGFAEPAFAYGLPVALDAARQAGIATLALARGQGAGTLGYFTEQVAAAGLIGLGLADDPLRSSRAIAFSVPDGHGGIALHLDRPLDTGEGAALGLMAEVLAAGMAGGALTPEPAAQQAGPEQFHLIVDPSTSPGFAARLAALAPGGGRVGFGAAAAGTVEVPDALWAAVTALAR